MTTLREAWHQWLTFIGEAPPSELERMFQLIERVQDAARKNSGGWLAERDLYLKDLKLAEDRTMRLCRNIVVEAVELLDSFNWKEHKVWRADAVNRDNIRVEIVDILHFVFEIALNWGITPAMIVADFEKKAAENIARQESGY
jgi:dimeric dUTPase (all-alpha-NTP-PPase superfamily)